MNSCKTLIGIFIVLAGVIGSFLLFYPLGFIYATYENLYGEWLQFSAFAGIAIFSFLIVKNHKLKQSWFFLLLGLAGFYTAMEEISWGQQIFHWDSMEFFSKHNLQGETNLHNLLTGPYSTLKKDLLTYALSFGFIAYGIVYPLLLNIKFGLAKKVESLGVPGPSLCLIPFFALAAFCEMSFYHFNEAELAELFVALAMCFVAVTAYYELRGGSDSGTAVSGKTYLVVFLVALLGSFLFTQHSIHSSFSEKRVANRIEAGVKKFAGRYARIKSWDHAIDLYQRHLAYEPQSRSRMRRLAWAYKRAGKIEEQQATLQQALALDLARLNKDNKPRASLHRSLYNTYKAMGDRSSSAKHIAAALRIDRQNIVSRPNSASAAYSMAQTYDLLDREVEAAVYYKRAFELKPGSSRYRRAYRESIEN